MIVSRRRRFHLKKALVSYLCISLGFLFYSEIKVTFEKASALEKDTSKDILLDWNHFKIHDERTTNTVSTMFCIFEMD